VCKEHHACKVSGQTYPPESYGPPIADTGPRQSDWVCGSCGINNFGSRARDNCFSCGAGRDPSSGEADVDRCKLFLGGLPKDTSSEELTSISL
jgi:hypothetical protein